LEVRVRLPAGEEPLLELLAEDMMEDAILLIEGLYREV
jgi:hypothetical protein